MQLLRTPLAVVSIVRDSWVDSEVLMRPVVTTWLALLSCTCGTRCVASTADDLLVVDPNIITVLAAAMFYFI
jgi:hypothetical protein